MTCQTVVDRFPGMGFCVCVCVRGREGVECVILPATLKSEPISLIMYVNNHRHTNLMASSYIISKAKECFSITNCNSL